MVGRYYTVGRAIDPYTMKSYPVQKLRQGSAWATKTYLRIPSVGYAIVFWKPLDGQRIEVYQRNEKNGTFDMKEMIFRLDYPYVDTQGKYRYIEPPPFVGSDAYNLWTGSNSYSWPECPNMSF